MDVMGGLKLLEDLKFFQGKRVFLTGHTGFKGSWLCQILVNAGAKLTGYSLEPSTNPSLFSVIDIEGKMDSVIGDIRNRSALERAFKKAKPEIVIHMAAQPLVGEGYQNPAYTFETNVMGTVNIMECLRLYGSSVKSFINVTTDKVYQSNEGRQGYRETDPLGGLDPYSNSKSCSELVTQSYVKSFLSNGEIAISTVRSGNLIGGGDFAENRIMSDCVKAAMKSKNIIVRNPHSVRPYQHVLEALFAYLMIAKKQYHDPSYADYYNVGPNDEDCISTGQLVDSFCQAWRNNQTWVNTYVGGPCEEDILRLDCTKLKTVFGWSPRWNYVQAIEKTVEWTREYVAKGEILAVMDRQIQEFEHKR